MAKGYRILSSKDNGWRLQDDPYHELATAIIRCAILDFRAGYKSAVFLRGERLSGNALSARRFLTSDTVEALIGVPGPVILEEIKRQVAEEVERDRKAHRNRRRQCVDL